MALTEMEQKWIEERIEHVSVEAAERIIEKVMMAHVASCPHGKKMMKTFFFMAGISIGCGFAGSGVAWGIIKLIMAAGG